MQRILLLGATGKLGQVLTRMLLEKDFAVLAFVRNPGKLHIKNDRLHIFTGELTKDADLAEALENVDAVISVLGHGFRTPYPIQEKAVMALIPQMEKKHIKRFIAITGANMHVSGDPKSHVATLTEKILGLIDPYRLGDAKKQQQLLEESDLDWTVIRTPVHSDKKGEITYTGFQQPPVWKTVSREAVCEFIISCIDNTNWNKKSPIVY